MSYLRAFARWLEERELAGRPDAARVAPELASLGRRIVDRAAFRSRDRVLDLGSGTGALAMAAADRGAVCVAIDLDAGAVARGRELARSIRARIAHLAADARALPLRDATFDASVHRSILVYMTDRARAVEEERRVLRPGGTVSCSESIGAELDLEADDTGIRRVWAGGLRDILLDDVGALTASELEALYIEAGFDMVELRVEPRRVPLDSPDAVARAFATPPPAGLSARERWLRAGVPVAFVDEFLARLASAAEQQQRVELVAGEAFLTARVRG